MLILGLDVGSRELKGTVLQRGILRQACTHGFRRALTAAPLPEQIAAALAEEAPGVDLVVIGVSRDVVTTRNVTLPFKDARKVAAVMDGVAEQNLPFPLRDAVVRYLISDDSAPAQTHALLLVVNKRDLAAALSGLSGVKVHESTVSVDSLGVANAWIADDPLGEATVLVDVGAKKTCVEVVSGGRLVYSRHLLVAGDAFTAAVAAKLKIPTAEAEALKVALGAAGEGPGVDEAQAVEAREALAQSYQKLARELKRTVLAARSQWPALALKQIQLCGGSARADGLAVVLGHHVELPVELYAPKILAGKAVAGDPAMAASAGLALTGIRKAKLEVDFLGKPRDIVRFHRKEIGLAIVIVMVMLLVSWVSARRDLALLRSENEDDDRDIAAGLARIAEVSKQAVNKTNLDQVAARLRKLQGTLAEDAASRLTLLNEIAHALPEREDVSFRNLTIDRGAVEVEGETDSFETVQKVEESFKKALGRQIDVQPPRNESREDKTITVFRLKFAADPNAEAKK